MKTKFRNHVALATVLALGLGSTAMAGNGFGDNMEKKRDEQRSDQPAPQPRAAQQRSGGERRAAPAQAPAQAAGSPPGYVQRGNHIGGNGAAAANIQRYGRPQPGGANGYRGGGYRNYNNRPPQYVNSLPYGYVRHNWNGRPYYYQGGHWYRPYGSQFVLAGPPFGLYVGYLPSYYTSFWYGNTRYFYADNTYYTYEPEQHGYIVSRSPYNDDAADEAPASDADQDMYIYPSRGQSEQQQSDDKYECHRWAADQTHYDPTDSKYSESSQTEYKRAITACLTGRGYSVK